MSQTAFRELSDAILDANFPDVDLALRRGRHIDQLDTAWYEYLNDASGFLEPFYRRFGAELVHVVDGYFYLLPTNDKLGKRHLSVPEMLVGQALALLYLDPRTIENGGNVAREDVLGHLASVMGTEALIAVLHTKKRRVDERVAEEAVRQKVYDALKRLALLGFVESLGGEQLKLRSALLRFAEPVRGADSPSDALAQLVARGEAVLGPGVDMEDTGDMGADDSDESDASDGDAGEVNSTEDEEFV